MKADGSGPTTGGVYRKTVTLSEEIVLQTQQWADDHQVSFSLAIEVLAWGGLFEECDGLLSLTASKEGRCAMAHVHECVEKAFHRHGDGKPHEGLGF